MSPVLSPARHWHKPHFVYRCYNTAGDLLYIGCTFDPRSRMKRHRYHSPWFAEVARTRFLVFPDHKAAQRAESRAIFTEQPRHNKYGLDGRNVPRWSA